VTMKYITTANNANHVSWTVIRQTLQSLLFVGAQESLPATPLTHKNTLIHEQVVLIRGRV